MLPAGRSGWPSEITGAPSIYNRAAPPTTLCPIVTRSMTMARFLPAEATLKWRPSRPNSPWMCPWM